MGLTRSDIDKWLRDNPDLSIEGEELPIRAEGPQSMEDILWHVIEEQRAQQREETPSPKFRSKTEERAFKEWAPTTGCIEVLHEAITVHLRSGRYQPDLVLRMPDRELWFVEVKGAWNAYQSGRSSKKSLKEAASQYWWLGRWFSLLPKKGGGWNLEEVKPKTQQEQI